LHFNPIDLLWRNRSFLYTVVFDSFFVEPEVCCDFNGSHWEWRLLKLAEKGISDPLKI
jgi:hypothetical protein